MVGGPVATYVTEIVTAQDPAPGAAVDPGTTIRLSLRRRHGVPHQEPVTRVASIDEALAFIRKRVDERVVLPEGLPAGVALAPEHPVSALRSTTPTGWMLHLVYGTKKHVYIQYGSAVFDGCGPVGARRISVGSVPGLLVASKHPSGWWSELIWPAKPTDTTGRYGLTGSLSPRHTLRMARSMPGTKLKSEATSSC
jgi:hypothetical protein